MNKKLAKLIASWMEAFAGPDGYELSRCEYVKEGAERYLRVYVDKLSNGAYVPMSTDDCEIVSRYLSEQLDREDPIQGAYYLEVSSPGLDRELVGEKDFDRFTGENVEIRLYRPVGGKKLYSGILKGYTEQALIIEEGEEEITLDRDQISKVRLAAF